MPDLPDSSALPASPPSEAPPRSLLHVLSPEPQPSKWRALFDHHGQRIINVVLFLVFGVLVAGDAYENWKKYGFDYIQVSFAVQNIAVVAMILLRKPQKAIDGNFKHQAIALLAFFSATLFAKEPKTASIGLLYGAHFFMMVSNVLGLVTILNLGRSFGILIALREVKTGGLYSMVRHPMYLTDILLRVGLVLEVPTPRNISLAVVSSGIYVMRAVLEERFLSHDPSYREYMQNVRYRFIPYVF